MPNYFYFCVKFFGTGIAIQSVGKRKAYFMNHSKLVVLENDIEHQGLPECIKDILDEHKETPHEIWWWFGEDVRQNPEKSISKFKSLAPDSFFISQPSFVGYGNSFDGKLFLFKKLMDFGVKISLGIAYYPDFYWFLINWMGEQRRPSVRIELFDQLKACLEFHEISYASPVDIQCTDADQLSLFKRLTWKDLMQNYFQRGDNVLIKETGVVVKLESVYLGNALEHCTFWYDDGIDRSNGKRIPIPELKRTEIEKVN